MESAEHHIAKISSAANAFVVSSGMAALDVILRLLKPGDEVIAGDDLYGGTNRLLSYRSEHSMQLLQNVPQADSGQWQMRSKHSARFRIQYSDSEIVGHFRRLGYEVTYGELAKRAGANAPTAAQDVGIAMARNPVPLIIPCHRVLAAGGKLGGFSAPGRTEAKQRMLALEGVFINKQPRLL